MCTGIYFASFTNTFLLYKKANAQLLLYLFALSEQMECKTQNSSKKFFTSLYINSFSNRAVEVESILQTHLLWNHLHENTLIKTANEVVTNKM